MIEYTFQESVQLVENFANELNLKIHPSESLMIININ